MTLKKEINKQQNYMKLKLDIKIKTINNKLMF